MKILLIFIFVLPLTLFAEGPMGENTSGRYGPESIFTEEGQAPMPPKEYNRDECYKAGARFRTFINRIRTISFRIERKCSKGSGNIHNLECSHHVSYLEDIYKLLNRQFVVMNNVCLGQ